MTLFLLSPDFAFGQKSDVYDELSSSFNYGKKSLEYTEASLGYIKKSHLQSSVEDVQLYARRAKNEIDYAKTQTGYAESDASDAEDEASDIGFDNTEDEADNAEGNFYSAKGKFDEAYTYLRRVEHADNKEDADYNLRRAKSSIEDGLRYLSYALEDLNDAVDELNNNN
ncbi:hypothetical protein [Pontibacter roseus]|uniref:hypothetical protein n=1 Tax=Pontibacter roseus TaxID=336989 RepID=UPI000371D516|nr:hypothetical protein [Pontibacter roseus]